MLVKRSGLSYSDVRERYEHFRSRCHLDPNNPLEKEKEDETPDKKSELGCTEPVYGEKSKCILKISGSRTTDNGTRQGVCLYLLWLHG